MRKLPEPINGAELYLEAVLGELRAIRALLEDGPPGPVAGLPAGHLPDLTRFISTVPQAVDGPVDPPKQPTKRTRVRPPRTA